MKKLKVLINDDDAQFLKVAIEKLSDRGFDVMVTQKAFDGLTLLKSEEIDAVLLDSNKENNAIILDHIRNLKKQPAILGITHTYSEEQINISN